MINETTIQLFQVGMENIVRDNLHYFVIPLFLGFIWFMYFFTWKDKFFQINQRDKKSSLMIGIIFTIALLFIIFNILFLNSFLRILIFIISLILVLSYFLRNKFPKNISILLNNFDETMIFLLIVFVILGTPIIYFLDLRNILISLNSHYLLDYLLLISYLTSLTLFRENILYKKDYFSLFDKNLKNSLIKKFSIIQKEKKGFLIKIEYLEKEILEKKPEFDFIKFEDMKYVKEFSEKTVQKKNNKK